MCTQSKKDVAMTKMEEINLRGQLAYVCGEQISEYHLAEIVSATKRLDPPSDTVILGISCGTGWIAYTLLGMGRKVVRLDFSGESLMMCKSRCGKPSHHKDCIYLIRAGACSLPLKGNFFAKCVQLYINFAKCLYSNQKI